MTRYVDRQLPLVPFQIEEPSRRFLIEFRRVIEDTLNEELNRFEDFRLLGPKTISSSSEAGEVGQIVWDSDYLYICVATDTWKRVALITW